ncbi:MAG: hypothetical protein LBR60_08320 [Fibrobacter sp.]|jgi:hypothetical protein|nr:hypothetical protein [Fibrobacter sp.]
MMRLFKLIGFLVVFGFFGCGDGKLNLPIVMWGENDVAEKEPVSSSIPEMRSSSSVITPGSSSSSEVIEPSVSSSEEPEPSSSSRAVRSSSSKEYEDYPPLIPGDPSVGDVGLASRYWDACKPSGSWIGNLETQNGGTLPNPLVFARNCDKNGREMPLFFKQYEESYIDHQTGQPVLTTQLWQSTPCASGDDTQRVANWLGSPEYSSWQTNYPSNFPGGEAYTCTDQTPYIVNDTLSYAFAASDINDIGKCFLLQFTGRWKNGEGDDPPPRQPHVAVKGKMLIVMVNNTGVGKGYFDIMIPGGGIGNCKNALRKQLDLTTSEIEAGILGRETGGLLSECIFGGGTGSYANIETGFVGNRGNTGERVELAEWQECLRAKCNRAFSKNPELLKGCMWHADWLMAADNPEALYKEVACPQYLIDRYRASPQYNEPPKMPPGNVACMIDGTPCLP